MVLCYLTTMGTTGCLVLGKWDHPLLLLLCLHQLEKQHKEGRDSKVFLQQYICCSRKCELLGMHLSLQHDLQLPELLKEEGSAGRKLNCSIIAL